MYFKLKKIISNDSNNIKFYSSLLELLQSTQTKNRNNYLRFWFIFRFYLFFKLSNTLSNAFLYLECKKKKKKLYMESQIML